ncbi:MULTISPECIES: hypothetical protein [Streptomyces violaceusniger group]|uniref:hypothetical protein n=1 Tax=Streptomyces violaceusniger group TaxID=2839105 RepID=UPI00117C081E|nr:MULTISPECIES: hypothetical protein [Streptomyces violaceusniger group]
MSRPPAGIRALRIAALPVIADGLGIHLWLGTEVGLAVAAAGLAAHLAVALLGRRWLQRRDHPLP